ncbi:Calmodulin [Hondaea fermentalgiana]|uniref:Calmodulin n=1 Tax=Hondaea fermentalgiana TaxID=2315210 RepID=A0A2R5GSL0_9STRA|nr:Calmodulin [Hondaea fermentalgiana]|eukprot:GBG33830.1 Calmodulin [Hondaea fermentalgiana]
MSASAFAVGDLVECRPYYERPEGATPSANAAVYVHGRVLKRGVPPPQNARAFEGEHYLVELVDAEKPKKQIIVPGAWTMPEGQGVVIWDTITDTIKRFEARGESARACLHEFLGDDSCVIEQFAKALLHMDPKLVIPHRDVFTQVLWRQGLLDKLAELVVWTKLAAHPDLAEIMHPSRPQPRGSGNDALANAREWANEVFRRFSPVKMSAIFEPLACFKGDRLTPKERDDITRAIATSPPNALCKQEDFVKLIDAVGIERKPGAQANRKFRASNGAGHERKELDTPEDGLTADERLEREMIKIVRLAYDIKVDCRDFFESFDLDFDNTISAKDFIKGMTQLGVRGLDANSLERIMLRRGLELSPDGHVDYRKFLALLAPQKWRRGSGVEELRANAVAVAALEQLRIIIHEISIQKKSTLEEVFADFDADNNGLIDRKEFSRGLRKLGIDLADSQVRILMHMFESTSENGRGIDARAFRTEILRKPAMLLALREQTSGAKPDSPRHLSQDILFETSKVLAKAKVDGTNLREYFESFACDSSSRALGIDAFFEACSKLGLVVQQLTEEKLDILNAFHSALAELEGVVRGRDRVDALLALAQLCPDGLLQAAAADASKHLVDFTFDQLVDVVADELARGTSMDACFASFDDNQNGLLSASEMHEALRALHLKLDLSKVRLLMQKFPGGKHGFVQREAFRQAIEERIKARAQFRGALVYAQEAFPDLASIFSKFDLKKKGKISLASALQALADINVHYTEDALLAGVGAKYIAKDKMELLYEKLFKDLAASKKGNVTKSLWSAPSTAIQETKLPSPVPNEEKELEQKIAHVQDQEPARSTFDQEQKSAHPTPSHAPRGTVARAHDVLSRLRTLVQKAASQGVSMVESFAHFDANSDGLITRSEFKLGLKKLGLKLGTRELEVLMTEFKVPGGDFIDITHFFKAMGPVKTTPAVTVDKLLEDLRALLRERQKHGADNQICFEYFDRDGTRSITERQLEDGLRDLNVSASRLQVRAIMNEYGVPHLDGAIDYPAFLRMIGVEEERMSVMRIIKRIRLGVAKTHTERAKASGDAWLQDLFGKNDHKRDGVLSLDDFLDVLRRLDLRLQDKEVERLVHFLDANNDGFVDFKEFIQQIEPPTSTPHVRAAVRKVQMQLSRRRADRHTVCKPFQHFDLVQNGTITKRDFRCAIAALGIRLEQVELKHLEDSLDIEENGKIHYNEFVQAAIGRPQQTRLRNNRQSSSRTSPMAGPASPTSPMSGNPTNDDPIALLETDLQDFIASAETMNIPLQETFRYFDRNGDGTVTWDEFHSAILELGFECTSDQLRKLMARVNGVSIPAATARTDGSRAASGRQTIDYNAFLKYWAGSQQPSGEGGAAGAGAAKDPRSERDIMKLVKKLRRELQSFLLESNKRGIKASDVFSHFDLNGDGTISIEEFEMALADIFADHEQFDERVLRRFTETLDDSKDGVVDYFEFLGIKRSVVAGAAMHDAAAESKKQSWQSLFGSRQIEKQRRSSLAVARFAIESILGAVATEVEEQGPIWQAQRRARIARLNNASFIQQNASAVRERVYCARKARVIPSKLPESESELASNTLEETSGRSTATASSSKSIERRMRIAKRMYVAEMAAARMAEEAAMRAEEAAEAKRLRNVEEGALRHALHAIGNVVFFASRASVVEFLDSIGLARFQDRINATSYLGRSDCYTFPLGNDQDMLSVLGTGSTIVARKVKRELLRLLHADIVPSGDPDPARWPSTQVSRFAATCGLDAAQFEALEIDGEALLELSVAEALDEIQVCNEVALQALLFRAAYMHFLAQSQSSRGHDEMSIASSTGTKNPSGRVFRSLVVDDATLPRPNEAPIDEWGTRDVVQLMSSLELPVDEVMALGVDGETLLELSDEEITRELGLRGPQLTKFRGAIEAVRQPPWMALGTGPYFEARLAASTSKDKLSTVRQDSELECTMLRVGREHDIWVHVGPALSEAFQVAQRVLRAGSEQERAKLVLAENAAGDTERAAKALTVTTADIDAEEGRVMEFIQHATRSGLPVLETFKSRDDQGDESLSLFKFEEALLALGYNCEDLGLLRVTLQSRLRDENRKTCIAYRLFYVRCLNCAEFHQPFFTKSRSSQKMAFSSDGSMVSLLMESYAPDGQPASRSGSDAAEDVKIDLQRTVRVRYGGGSALYDATIVCDHKNGSYDVQFEETGEVRVVPFDWVEFRSPALPSRATSSSRVLNLQLASCEPSFSRGIHVWRMAIRHLVNDIALGVSTLRGGKRRFVGMDCRGNLICQGYSAAKVRSMQRFARLNKRGYSVGESILVRLDLDAQELHLFLAPQALDAKACIDDLEELARIRLQEVHKMHDVSSSTQTIRSFVRRKKEQIEKFLQRKMEHHQRVVPVSVISCELFELGLEARETDLFAFLQPFLHRRKDGIDPVAMLEGLNLASDKRWESDSEDDDADVNMQTGAHPASYEPGILLRGAGDAVQTVEARKATSTLAQAKLGALVQVRYGGGSTWYEGKIVDIERSEDGGAPTFGIQYEDGETEFGVRMSNMRISRQEQAPTQAPQSRLFLQLYCRLLAYMAPVSVNQREDRLAQRQAKMLEKSRRSTAARGRYWQKGQHHEVEIASPEGPGASVPMRSGASSVRNISTTRPQARATQVQMRGSTFSDVGGLRTQELLRKRLNTPHPVNWSQTTSVQHQFYAPLAIKQQGGDRSEGQSESEYASSRVPEAVVSDQAWTLVGSVDVEAMQKVSCGEAGIPVSLRLDAPSDRSYYRICFMGILGTVSPSGVFTKIQAPVEPVRAVMNKSRVRIGGGWEHDVFDSLAESDNADFSAGRFFLLSGAITAHGKDKSEASADSRVNVKKRQSSTSKKRAKANQIGGLPQPPHRGMQAGAPAINQRSGTGPAQSVLVRTIDIEDMGRSNEFMASNRERSFQQEKEVSSVDRTIASNEADGPYMDERIEDDHNSAKDTVRGRSPRRKGHRKDPHLSQSPSRRFRSPPRTSSLQASFSEDEKIVIDRWLHFAKLNEFGEPHDMVDEFEALGSRENRMRNRFQNVAFIHPEKPWFNMARERGWLPGREEQRKIRHWVRRTKTQRPSRRSTTQTLYEALVQGFPEKPWLERVPQKDRSGNKKDKTGATDVSQGRPVAKQAVSLKKNGVVSPQKKNKKKAHLDDGRSQVTLGVAASTSAQGRVQQELERGMDHVKRNPQRIDEDIKKLHEIRAGLDLQSDAQLQHISRDLAKLYETKAGLEAIAEKKHVVNADELRRVAQVKALEATLQANEEAQLAWEREQRLRQAQRLQLQQAQVDRRETRLQHLEAEVRANAQRQSWAQRVDDAFVAQGGRAEATEATVRAQRLDYGDEDEDQAALERAVSRTGKNIPL